MEKTNCKLFFATNSPISIELTEKLISIKDSIVSYAVRNYAHELVVSNYCFCEPEAAKEMKSSWINNHRSSLDLFVEDYLTITNQIGVCETPEAA